MFQPISTFSWRRFADEWLKTLLMAAVIFLVMNLFFPRYYVEGKSMEPQLHESDALFATSIDVLPESIIRGDIIVLSSPRDGTVVVKRVIGLPGETIEVHDGTVFINGEALVEDYINERPNYTGSWELGENEYFVLGDNRNHSLDSADYGPVDIDLIHSKVQFRYWPPNGLGAFSAPTYGE